MTYNQSSRRDFLKNAGLAAFAQSAISDISFGAVEKPKRLIMMFHPLGMHWPDWSKYNGSPTNFTLLKTLEPLEPHKQDIIVIDGVNVGYTASENGKIGIENYHWQSLHAIFSGTGIRGNYAVDPRPKGPTLDYFCSEFLHSAKHRMLQFGVQSNKSAAGGLESAVQVISCSKGGVFAPAINNPMDIYKQVFGNLPVTMTPGGVVMPTAPSPQLLLKKSMLDGMLVEFESLKKLVGSQTRIRLDADLASFREMEKSLAALIDSGGTNPNVSIQPPDSSIYKTVDLNNDADHLKIGKMQMDLMLASFRADLTRVTSFMWGSGSSGLSVKWLPTSFGGYGQQYHNGLSHISGTGVVGGGKESDVQGWIGDIVRVYAQQMAYLISELKKTPEIDGSGDTMFDNTVIVWCSELDNVQHSASRLPYVIMGSAGKKLKTGQHLQGKYECTDVLDTVAKALGSTAPGFGFAGGNKGVIPGMMA